MKDAHPITVANRINFRRHNFLPTRPNGSSALLPAVRSSLYALLVLLTALPGGAEGAIVRSTTAPGAIYLPLVQQPLPKLIISEFMASNQQTLLDEDGEAADWIEVRNVDSQPVNLNGWSLTDDAEDLTKWIFPALTLQPGQYLVVFASDKDRTSASPYLHTNFKLGSEGEYLALVAPGGSTIATEFAPHYPPQSADVSYGVDAAGNLRYFTEPTPGSANGTGGDDQGPAISNVQHFPAIPTETENLLVLAYVTGNPSAVTLQFRVMFNDEGSAPMYDDGAHGDGVAGDGLYGALVPHDLYATGELIRYAVTAADRVGRTSRVPTPVDDVGGDGDGNNSAPVYRGTVAGADSYTSDLPILHWFVGSPSKAEKREGTRAAVFYDGRYYDNIFVRLRGGEVASHWPKKNFKFDFNPGDHFFFSPDEDAVEEFNLNTTWSDKSYIRQVLSWETYRDAGVPYSISFPMRVHQNGQFYSVAIFVEQPDERYLERQNMDPDGALYKMYTSLTSSGGDEDKTDSAQKKTRLYEDKSDLQAFIDGLNLPDEEVGAFLFDNVDIPQVINYLAATVLTHDNDHVGKNYYLYRNSNTNLEWQMLPWDKDLTFGRNYTGEYRYLVDEIWADDDPYSHPLFGDSDHRKVTTEYNLFIDVLYEDPRIRSMFLRRLRTVMDALLQPPDTPYAKLRYEARIDQLYRQMAPDVTLDAARWPIDWGSEQDFDEALTILKEQYLYPRRYHLYVTHGGPDDDIPPAQTGSPRIHFGGYELGYGTPNEDSEYFTLYNPNSTAVDISGWRVADGIEGGVAYTFRPGVVIPARSTLYVSPNVVAFRARTASPRGGEGHFVQGDYSGRLSHRSGELTLYDLNDAPISTLQYTAGVSSLASRLRITEINYHPPDGGGLDGDEFEFVELQNVSGSAIELANLRFVDGIDFTFPNGTLEPGGILVLARNPSAFAQRYGTVQPAGFYTKNLANSGERITLVDGAGYPVFSFTYSDAGLWPRAADGDGPTLVRTEPYRSPSNPCEWGPSASDFGSPGRADAEGILSSCADSLYLPFTAR